MFTFSDAARTELADLLETIAEEGLPEPRDPDTAMDAIQALACACTPPRIKHCVHIVTIVDRCAFDQVIKRRAFTNDLQARQWGVDECARLLASYTEDHGADEAEMYDPSASTMEVEYA